MRLGRSTVRSQLLVEYHSYRVGILDASQCNHTPMSYMQSKDDPAGGKNLCCASAREADSGTVSRSWRTVLGVSVELVFRIPMRCDQGFDLRTL